MYKVLKKLSRRSITLVIFESVDFWFQKWDTQGMSFIIWLWVLPTPDATILIVNEVTEVKMTIIDKIILLWIPRSFYAFQGFGQPRHEFLDDRQVWVHMYFQRKVSQDTSLHAEFCSITFVECHPMTDEEWKNLGFLQHLGLQQQYSELFLRSFILRIAN